MANHYKSTAGLNRHISTAADKVASTERVVKRRATTVCKFCRERKIRCDVSKYGSPCHNCQFHQTECITLTRKSRRSVSLVVIYLLRRYSIGFNRKRGRNKKTMAKEKQVSLHSNFILPEVGQILLPFNTVQLY